MKLRNKELGNLGEKIAVKYLKKKGYKILDQNFRYKKYGEIDIIAKKDKKDIVFIEVKTRYKKNFREMAGNYVPEDNITYFKQKQLIKLSKIYLANVFTDYSHPQEEKQGESIDIPWQIDAIAIEIDPISEKSNLRHIEQAIIDFD